MKISEIISTLQSAVYGKDMREALVSLAEYAKENHKGISYINVVTTTSQGSLLGDLNGDGIVDNADKDLLLQYIVDKTLEIDVEAADINGDGNVNNADIVDLAWLLENKPENQNIARIETYYSDGTKSMRYAFVSEGTKKKEISKIEYHITTSTGKYFGDINEDGVVDNSDLIALDRYIQGYITEIDEEIADINGDGIVDEVDLELLGNLLVKMKDNEIIGRFVITYVDDSVETFLYPVNEPENIDSSKATAYSPQILESYTAVARGKMLIGTMPDFSSRIFVTNQIGNIITVGGGKVFQIFIPTRACYDTNSSICVDVARLAEAIGLTADKIVTGNTILGIEGIG